MRKLAACALVLVGTLAIPSQGLPAAPGEWGKEVPAAPLLGERPNILLIVVDDQRAGEGTLEVMDKTRRWLMEGGTRFTDAFSTTPLCCPARASIFSGLYAHNHGVYTNLGKLEFDFDNTIQDYLDEDGYNTGIAGKLFNNWRLRRDPPHFDEWAVFDGGYSNRTYNVNGRMRTVPTYSTSYLRDKSERFLKKFESTDSTPWFLYVAPYAPHAPFTPKAIYKRSPVPAWNGNPAVFEKKRSDKPKYVLLRDEKYETWRHNRKLQLRTLMSVDDLVGGLRGKLVNLEEMRNTLVVYLSDNGYMWADHGLYDKGAPYTPSIRVPFLLRYPAGPQLPRVDRRIVGNIDVAPTILDAAGIEPQQEMDGASLFDGDWDRKRLLAEYKNSGNPWTPPTWVSTRTSNWQYTEYYDNGKRIDREYYDLRRDPWQLRNLLGDRKRANNPDGLRKVSKQLRRDRHCEGANCP
jgi:arylsulfatase A-like enzyme